MAKQRSKKRYLCLGELHRLIQYQLIDRKVTHVLVLTCQLVDVSVLAGKDVFKTFAAVVLNCDSKKVLGNGAAIKIKLGVAAGGKVRVQVIHVDSYFVQQVLEEEDTVNARRQGGVRQYRPGAHGNAAVRFDVIKIFPVVAKPVGELLAEMIGAHGEELFQKGPVPVIVASFQRFPVLFLLVQFAQLIEQVATDRSEGSDKRKHLHREGGRAGRGATAGRPPWSSRSDGALPRGRKMRGRVHSQYH